MIAPVRSTAGILARVTAVAALWAVAAALLGAGSASAASAAYRALGVTANGAGYAAINSSGQVYAFGSVQYRANPQGFNGEIVGISVTADGAGYAAISSTGQVYAYGSVQYRGNPAGFSGGIVGISVTADGKGYAAVSGNGQVYAYGTVQYRGNADPNSGTSVRDKIVTTARAEFANAGRNKEQGGYNCNFYSTQFKAGTRTLPNGKPACSNSWYSEAWCADFARWVWGQAGAKTTGLGAGAASFRTSPLGTWHPSNPKAGDPLAGVQVGDAIVFAQDTSTPRRRPCRDRCRRPYRLRRHDLRERGDGQRPDQLRPRVADIQDVAQQGRLGLHIPRSRVR
jgi:hypothetical protein